MLSGLDLEVVGYWSDESEEYCRACAVKVLGEATVARITEGLCAGTDWQRMTRYEAEEHAGEMGYEYGGDHPPGGRGHRHYPTIESAGELYCESDAKVRCFECGKLLAWGGPRRRLVA